MYIIGENIHIISDKVKNALRDRDREFFMELALKQVEAGAQAVDLNMGPRKKDWEELFPWIVETVETVVDVPLSFDSTNIMGIEAGLKKVTKAQPIINSTSAEPERLEKVPLLAKKYNTRLIALTMGKSGIPVGSDERVNIAIESLIPRCLEVDFPIEDLIIDPLVLTVSGCQEYCPELIEAVRTLQFAWDPPPSISVGLSNVSNAVPMEIRPIPPTDEDILLPVSVQVADLDRGYRGRVLDEDRFRILEGAVLLLIAQQQAEGRAEGDDIEPAVAVQIIHPDRLEGLIDNHAPVVEVFFDLRYAFPLAGIRFANQDFKP